MIDVAVQGICFRFLTHLVKNDHRQLLGRSLELLLLKVDSLYGESALDSCANDWRELEARSTCTTVFQTYEWHDAWWRSIGKALGVDEPLVLRFRAEGQTVGLLPLMRSREGHTRVLRFMSAPAADYHDILLDKDVSPESVRSCVLAALADELSTMDGIELDELRPGATLLRILDSSLQELDIDPHPSSRCPYLQLLPDAIRKATAGKTHARKKRKLVREVGSLAWSHASTRSEISAHMPVFIDMHRAQWKDRDGVAGSFEDAYNVDFFNRLATSFGAKGWLVLSRMSAGDQPTAFDFSFRYRGSVSNYRSTFNNSLKHLSPGHLLFHRMFNWAADNGAHEYDFLRGEYRYKLRYASGERCNTRLCTRESTIPLARPDGIIESPEASDAAT